MLDNKQGHFSRVVPGLDGPNRTSRRSIRRVAGRSNLRWARSSALGSSAERIGLPSTVRACNLVGERLRLGIGRHPKLALQGLGAALVLPQRFAAAAGFGIGANQGTLAELGERVERHQPTSRLDCCLGLAVSNLLCCQSVQDVANQGKRAVTFGCEPFLKGLGIDYEIGKEFPPIQLRRRSQLGFMLRAG